MQEMESVLCDSGEGGERGRAGGCLRFAGMVEVVVVEDEGKAPVSPSKPSAASVASLGMT